jgi:hypothetical protein
MCHAADHFWNHHSHSSWFVVFPGYRLQVRARCYQKKTLLLRDFTPQSMLHAADEYFEYWGYPGEGRWMIYGMELPDPVLEKVYHLNAEKVFLQLKW